MKTTILKKGLAFFLSLAMLITGTGFFGATASAKAKKASVRLNKTSAKLLRGKKLTLKLKKTNIKKLKSQSWSTGNKKVATVSKKGVVTAKSKGKTTIKVKVTYIAKGAKKAKRTTLKCRVTVTEPVTAVSRIGAMPFINLSSTEIVQKMGLGWNLGNTLDAFQDGTPSETAWHNVVTTREIIKKVHDKGFNTIRIPVTWWNYINADYSVKEEWIARVQEIVDYAIDEDMYVVINVHHDGAQDVGWLDLDDPTGKDFVSDADFEKILARFKGLWKTVATRFENYDEHLLFEGMNEVWSMKAGYNYVNVEYQKQDMKRINTLNRSFVDVVRATGGNNDKRWLICPVRNTEIPLAIDEKYGFEMPKDSAKHLMLAVHNYTSVSLSGVVSSFKEDKKDTIAYNYKKLKEMYIDKGIPVFIGEYGTLNTQMKNRTAEGLGYFFKKYGMASAVWDNSYHDTDKDNMAVFDRATITDCIKDGYSICDSLLRGYFYDTRDEQVTEAPVLTALTAFELSCPETLSLKAGESCKVEVQNRRPEDSNDVVVWSSSDSTVASVYNGTVVARSIGNAVITASSKYDGAVRRKIAVSVGKTTLQKPTTDIISVKNLSLSAGEQGHMAAYALPAGNGAELKYESADSSIAVVSSVGTVRAVKEGQTTIKLTSSDGVTKEVAVLVSGKKQGAALKAAGTRRMREAASQESETAYNGYLAFQLGGYWVSRADYMDESTGLSVTEYVNSDHKSYGSAPFDYHSMVVASNPKKGAKNQKNAEQYLEKVSISDSVVKENGSYEAVIDGFDATLWEDMGNAAWNMLFLSTDIPLTMKGVTCKDMTVYIDDKELVHLDKAPHNTEASTNKGVYQFYAFDTYGETHGTTKGGAVQPLKNGTPVKKYAVFPKKSIRITYTIEGVDFDAGTKKPAQPAGPVVGKSFSGQDGFRYSVTERAKDDGTKGKVKLIGLTAAGKKQKMLTIPNAIKYAGLNYKVTALKSGAFAGNKTVQKVVLSTGLKSIPAKAFQNCTKLCQISVKSKVKVSKNAFKGCKKTIKISGSRANKKYFKDQMIKSGYKKVK